MLSWKARALLWGLLAVLGTTVFAITSAETDKQGQRILICGCMDSRSRERDLIWSRTAGFSEQNAISPISRAKLQKELNHGEPFHTVSRAGSNVAVLIESASQSPIVELYFDENDFWSGWTQLNPNLEAPIKIAPPTIPSDWLASATVAMNYMLNFYAWGVLWYGVLLTGWMLERRSYLIWGEILVAVAFGLVIAGVWHSHQAFGAWMEFHAFPSVRDVAYFIWGMVAFALSSALFARLLLLDKKCRSSSTVCYCCSYNLTGNVSGICPECGTAIPKYTNPAMLASTGS